MRRALSALIMAMSLTVASVAWAAFVLSHTVLDPGRSERLADQLLDNEEIRAVMVDRLADAIESQIPADVPVSRDLIEQAADTALEDPAVETLIRDNLVLAHQNALNGIDEPIMVDTAVLSDAGRRAVVAANPELDTVLPAAPSFPVQLPSTGLSWLGAVKLQVDRAARSGAIVALIGVAVAFALSKNRPKSLRRLSYWAFASSGFWLAVAYGLPWLLTRIAPSTVTIAVAAIDVFFGAMVSPALTMGAVGVGLYGASVLWRRLARRRPAAALDRASRRSAAAQPGGGQGTPGGWQSGSRPDPAAQRGGYPSIGARQVGPAPMAPSQQYRDRYEPTSSFPVVVSRFDGDTAPIDTAPRFPGDGGRDDRPTELAPGPRWEVGVGYLDPVAGEPPDDATVRAWDPDRPPGR